MSGLFRRVAPALVLFFLSPFVAEVLLGDLAGSQLAAFPILAVLYGGGAIFIREIVRRTGRGWPTLLLLALTYGVLEEAFATQSLFNPNYLGLRLLDDGYIARLGIGGPWTIYVLTIHMVWSIAVPIALTDAIFPQRRDRPWFGWPGLVVSGVIYLLGLLAITTYSHSADQYKSSGTQSAVSALVVVVLVVVAFLLQRNAGVVVTQRIPGTWRAPNPWLLGAVTLLVGLIFLALKVVGLPGAVKVLAMLALEAGVAVLLLRVSQADGWSEAHGFAVAAGGALVYCCWGFQVTTGLHGASGVPVQAIWALLMVALLVLIGVRLERSAPAAQPDFGSHAAPHPPAV